MSEYDEMYRIGFEEGKIIGRMEFYLSTVRVLFEEKITNNYEEILILLEIPEEDRARMMDYLPVSRELWIIPSDSE